MRRRRARAARGFADGFRKNRPPAPAFYRQKSLAHAVKVHLLDRTHRLRRFLNLPYSPRSSTAPVNRRNRTSRTAVRRSRNSPPAPSAPKTSLSSPPLAPTPRTAPRSLASTHRARLSPRLSDRRISLALVYTVDVPPRPTVRRSTSPRRASPSSPSAPSSLARTTSALHPLVRPCSSLPLRPPPTSARVSVVFPAPESPITSTRTLRCVVVSVAFVRVADAARARARSLIPRPTSRRPDVARVPGRRRRRRRRTTTNDERRTTNDERERRRLNPKP